MQMTRNFSWPCLLLTTVKVLMYFNLAQTPSIFGFVKTAWPLIQINQLLFCSVPHKGLNLCPDFNLNVAGAVNPLSDKVKILGAMLDANLTMAPYIKALSSSCFYHIRSFGQIRSSFDDTMALSVASALISSCLDQLNSIFIWHFGASLKHIARLQRIQHAAARVVLNLHSHTSSLSSSELLKRLHWLPIEWRIWFKLATLTFKALHTGSHIFPTSCNTTNPRGLCTHLVLIIF